MGLPPVLVPVPGIFLNASSFQAEISNHIRLLLRTPAGLEEITPAGPSGPAALPAG